MREHFTILNLSIREVAFSALCSSFHCIKSISNLRHTCVFQQTTDFVGAATAGV